MPPTSSGQPGAVALLGSGEYLDVMNETDRFLVEIVGGTGKAHVALIPTASGLEPGSPDYWNDLGLDHFRPLAKQVSALPLLAREHTEDEGILATLREANVFYFSGGSPQYLMETFTGSAAWDTIVARLREGAAIAGCSAGAIMLGTYRTNFRSVMAGEPATWGQAMGVVPHVAVLPHFDRAWRRIGEDVMKEHVKTLLSTAPSDAVIAGVEEDTALVGWPGDAGWQWQVQGRQNVWLLWHGDDAPTVFESGAMIPSGILPETAIYSESNPK